MNGPEQVRRRAAELEHARVTAPDEESARAAADELHALLDDVDEEEETLCECGRPDVHHGRRLESGVRQWTCGELAEIAARIAYAELPVWERVRRRAPVGWRSR